MKKIETSVIFTTYNSIPWLEKVLWGFECQSFSNFEIIIADDGSSQETHDFIASYKLDSPLKIKHVWHEDNGFRKTEILNKAIIATSSDYLIFTDGDCIPREDFVETHMMMREEKMFLSGGYYKLPLSLSEMIDRGAVVNQDCFKLNWLRKHGLSLSLKNLKLVNSSLLKKILNFITPTTPSWNGHNASTWKALALEVNGFDERMKYGGEDREFGERLINYGLTSKQIRYSAICLHLEHARGYVSNEDIIKNQAIRENTKKMKVKITPFGIKK